MEYNGGNPEMTIYIDNSNNNTFHDFDSFKFLLISLFNKKDGIKFMGGIKQIRIIIEGMDNRNNEHLINQLIYNDPENTSNIINYDEIIKDITGGELKWKTFPVSNKEDNIYFGIGIRDMVFTLLK